jgi:hypothetical protein
LIASAAQAVDDTIGAPESEPLLLGACAAIVEGARTIAALKAAMSRSEKVVARSVELRRKSARFLYDSIRSEAGEKFER